MPVTFVLSERRLHNVGGVAICAEPLGGAFFAVTRVEWRTFLIQLQIIREYGVHHLHGAGFMQHL